MAQAELEQAAPETAPEIELESGTYEIIRNRLSGFGKQLREQLGQLNDARREVFGSIETTLLATERITTEHNCVPRDMVSVGDVLLFGYNVHFGLKTETNLSDVFAVYKFQDLTFHSEPLDLIKDEKFERDFKEVFRYYKNAVFAKFMRLGPYLYMIFRVGKNAPDIKTFKWQVLETSLRYIDNRSDHEVRYPPQHEFQWTRTHRDLHQFGDHPHISIHDRLFVETIGGDLTIKIENNTASGEGIYAEEVEDPDQTLDDADIYYAIVGSIILLKIKPYQEKEFRYIAYNEKTQTAVRIDSIADACVLLPDDHGLIFSNGYYLQSGDHKTFDHDLLDMVFERRLPASNGEDYLYVFYNRMSGTYILLKYNVIEQRIDTPLICHGFSFFPAGELVCFKAQDDPQKHHAIQVWQTPYVGEDHVPHENTDSFLYKIGNREIVRGMSESHEVLGLISREDTYASLYIDLVKKTSDVVDSYFWLDKPEAFNLSETLVHIRDAASAAVDEFEKVVRVKQNTLAETNQTSSRSKEIINAIHHKRFEKIDDFVTSLGDLRSVRGEIIALRDLRYVDIDLVDKLEKDVTEQSDTVAKRCVQFLLRPDALAPYAKDVNETQNSIPELEKVSEAKKVEESIEQSGSELEMLIEIVSNLKIDDATQRTAIIDNISSIFSTLNQARSLLKNRKKELLSVEGVAEFNSQMKLLNQAVVNYLDVCDSPGKCDEYLTKVMIQLEELEGRFAEFDEFIVQLSDKREEVYSAFESRKLSLVEARNRRANALLKAADRILKGIKTRVESLDSINEIHGYFASDLMIEKVRDIVDQLDELDDTVKVDDVQSRLKTIREDAVRQLKDRQELFVGGDNIIKFGNHQFTVNVQSLDLTVVSRDDQLSLHLTGTDFFETISDSRVDQAKDLWNQELISENRDVYRGEYLTHALLEAIHRGELGELKDIRRVSAEDLTGHLQRFMGPRYSEGYVKGVHDHDAAIMIRALLELEETIGELRYHPNARAMSQVFWDHWIDHDTKSVLDAMLKGAGKIESVFERLDRSSYLGELTSQLSRFATETGLFGDELAPSAGQYLFTKLASGTPWVISGHSAAALKEFKHLLEHRSVAAEFEGSIKAVRGKLASCIQLLRDWVAAFLSDGQHEIDQDNRDEIVCALLDDSSDHYTVVDADCHRDLSGLVGSHSVIQSGNYRLHYNRFGQKLNRYVRDVVSRFVEFHETKHLIIEEGRASLKLNEFKPRVLTSFVRNKLIDTVYLPLVGDNLAKQIGAAGEQKRTDLMGLLLLVSPPGYGKTTLMEYIANRLGIIFMKINGPAIGHHVTSLDPNEAPNASAREEVEKLNLALEMGDNVMIYLDDIQHCNPELLQKFISLCDAQRKIEGVYKGRTKTYDLRGKKVAVVMAGNPYTESGERFQIPDMLSNRADIYNLGEIIGDSATAFEMSYIENSLTSNPVLSKLASRSQKDVYAVIKMAESDSREGLEFEGNYSVEELNEIVATMKKLMVVRNIILKVNREYIRSAAQSDEYRTEPPFKLQGSYRNMNRIAEKVFPILNDSELRTLIVSNYENDAQTLTSDSESNLLKFKELMEIQTETEAQRWDDIKRAYVRSVRLKGIDSNDRTGQVIAQMSSFTDGLDSIRRVLRDGITQMSLNNGQPVDVEAEAEAAEWSLRAREITHELQAIRDAVGEAAAKSLQAVEARKKTDAGELNAEVGQVATALEAIRQVLEHSPEPAAPQPQPFDPSALTELISELRKDSKKSPPAPADAKITVVNKVPSEFLKVVQQQFRVMQRWLDPILKESRSQNKNLQRLCESLQNCLTDYDGLAERLKQIRKG